MVEHLVALMVLLSGPAEPTAAPPTNPKVPEAAAPTAPVPTGAESTAPKAAAAAPAPAAARSGEAKPAAKEDDVASELSALPVKPATPPALAKSALCGELTRSGKELAAARKKLDEDRKAFEAEKAQLEKLNADIVQSRAALRAETEHLEQLLNKRAEAPSGANAPSGAEKPKVTTPAAPLDLESLAKTMKSMKPEAAAALIQRTEQPLAAALLKRMKPADAGAVMDRLKPDLAAELVAMMAAMPGSTPSKGGKP